MAANSEGLPTVGINELLEAGLHFGHQSKRWNPKMKRFIFGKHHGIYVIDLEKSLAQLKLAQKFVYDVVSHGRSVLFVGTKKQAQALVKEGATRCGMPYVVTRWLGGTLTNCENIRSSVKHMKDIEEMEAKGLFNTMPQKEVSKLRHELAGLQKNLSGISAMKNLPGAMFTVDVNCEAIAIKEANRLQIPVLAIVDTNCDPDSIDYPIPGNDDSLRAIKLIVDILAETIIKAAAEYSQVAAEEARQRAADIAAGKTPAPSTAPRDDTAERPTRKRPERRGRPGGGGPGGGGGGRSGGGGGGGGGHPRKRSPGPGRASEKKTAPAAAATPAAPETPAAPPPVAEGTTKT